MSSTRSPVGVAEGVVDDLEVVEVQEHDRDARPLRLLTRHRVLDAVAEQRAVREQRQRIVQRHAHQLLLHALAVGDVAQVEQPAADRRLSVHVGAVDLDHALALVAARHADLDDAGCARLGEVAGHELPEPRAVVEDREFVKVQADEVLCRGRRCARRSASRS